MSIIKKAVQSRELAQISFKPDSITALFLKVFNYIICVTTKFKRENGTRYTKTEKEIKLSLGKVLAKIEEKEHIIPEQLMVGRWLEGWLANYAYISVRHSTDVFYSGHTKIRHVKKVYCFVWREKMTPIQTNWRHR